MKPEVGCSSFSWRWKPEEPAAFGGEAEEAGWVGGYPSYGPLKQLFIGSWLHQRLAFGWQLRD